MPSTDLIHQPTPGPQVEPPALPSDKPRPAPRPAIRSVTMTTRQKRRGRNEDGSVDNRTRMSVKLNDSLDVRVMSYMWEFSYRLVFNVPLYLIVICIYYCCFIVKSMNPSFIYNQFILTSYKYLNYYNFL